MVWRGKEMEERRDGYYKWNVIRWVGDQRELGRTSKARETENDYGPINCHS